MQLKITVNGKVYDVDVEVEEPAAPTLSNLHVGGSGPHSPNAAPTSLAVAGHSANGVKAPLSGTVARVLVEAGQAVKTGDVLVVLEAMKMETEITAPADGTVASIEVSPGDQVTGGAVLVELS